MANIDAPAVLSVWWAQQSSEGDQGHDIIDARRVSGTNTGQHFELVILPQASNKYSPLPIDKSGQSLISVEYFSSGALGILEKWKTSRRQSQVLRMQCDSRQMDIQTRMSPISPRRSKRVKSDVPRLLRQPHILHGVTGDQSVCESWSHSNDHCGDIWSHSLCCMIVPVSIGYRVVPVVHSFPCYDVPAMASVLVNDSC